MSRVRFKLNPNVPLLLLSYRHGIGFVYYSIISTLIGFTCPN